MALHHQRGLTGALTSGLLFVAGVGATGAPQKQTWTLDHFQHRAYTVNDGLPQDGTTLIAQTADGIIWLTVPDGLMTFDGSHFRHFDPLPGEQLLSSDIPQMMGPSSGGLWIRYRRKGDAFIRDGHITNVPTSPGGKGSQPSYFFQDRAGAVWSAAEDGGFFRFDGVRWQKSGVDDAPEKIRGVATDSHFNVWVIGLATGEIYRRRETDSTFTDMGVRAPKGFSLSVPTDDTVFVASLSRQMYRFRVVGNALVECGAPLPGLGFGVLADHHGGGWMATVTDGLHYFPSLAALCGSPPAEGGDALLSNKASGASGDLAMTALVDKEGNVWSTSEGGLDRLTRSAFSRVRFPRSINMATLAAAGDGSLWVGNESADVFHYTGGEAVSVGVAPSALALATSPQSGQVLAASGTGVWSLGDKPSLIAPLPHGNDASYVAAIFQEPAGDGGAIWLAFGETLYRYENHAWKESPRTGRVKAIYAGAPGTVWLVPAQEDLLIEHTLTGLRSWTPKDGLDVGEVKVVAYGAGGTWVGGERGVQFHQGRAFHRLSLSGVAPPDGVTGVVFDDDGNLWIHATNGLYRIRAAAAASFAGSNTAAVPADVFTASDGLPGLASQQHSLPSLIKGADGRLWVQGGSSVAWIDPHDVPARPAPSPPVILGVTAGHLRSGPTTAAVLLARDQRTPVFSYAAPATTDATRVRFQTRLTGFDDGWVDQGNHREAAYPRIPAGHYVFSVRASTDGVTWTADPPKLAISVEPFFHETGWFKMVCAVAGLVALWFCVRWETRRALRRYRARMQIRMEEREAIARDLHDTLLQSNVALVLQLEAIYQRASDGDTRTRIAMLADRADAAVREGRMRVTALRDRPDDGDDFCTLLQGLGTQLALQSETRFHFVVDGEPRALKAPGGDEVRLLLSEAITNAFRHAKATEVCVTVTYGTWRWMATVTDDGIGMDTNAVEPGARHGHWGMAGMQERASKVRARLVIRPALPKGTRVRLSVCAWRIYAGQGSWPLFKRWGAPDGDAGP